MSMFQGTASRYGVTQQDATPQQLVVLVGWLVAATKAAGQLVCSMTSVTDCEVCGSCLGYIRRRDAPDQRVTMSGVTAGGDTSIEPVLRGVVDSDALTDPIRCCYHCWYAVKPLLRDALQGVRAAVPESVTGTAPKWVRSQNRRCGCGWTGSDADLVRVPDTSWRRHYFMGTTWPGCPRCGATNRDSDNIQQALGHVLVAVEVKR